MSRTVTRLIDGISGSLGSPTALKVGLMFWVIMFTVAQMTIIFGFIEPKIDASMSMSAAFGQVTDFKGQGVMEFGKAAVTLFALALIKIKVVVLVLAALVAASMILIPIMIPDSWIEPINELVLLGEIGMAAAFIVISALEIIPFF